MRYRVAIAAALIVALIGVGVARAAPANNDFSNATPISGTSAFLDAQSNAGATTESGEPATIAGQPAGASVWYVWTPTITASALIETCPYGAGSGTNFDTLLGIYTGSAVNALTGGGSLAGEMHERGSPPPRGASV